MDIKNSRFAGARLAASGPDTDAGPGCRFADFDADTDVDLDDFAAFTELFAASD